MLNPVSLGQGCSLQLLLQPLRCLSHPLLCERGSGLCSQLDLKRRIHSIASLSVHRTMCAIFLARSVRIASRRWLSTYPEHRKLVMPKVSPTMTHGRFVAWKKKIGEPFEEGDDLADVESDKATMPISAREDGYIARTFVEADTPDIPLGRLLAITVEEEEFISAFADYVPKDAVPASATPSAEADSAKSSPTTDSAPTMIVSSEKAYTGPIGPALARLLSQHPKIDLNRITPTGPKGRILKGDVLAAIENGTAFTTEEAKRKETPAASPATSSSEPTTPVEQSVFRQVEYTDVPVSSMRRAIARRVLESKQVVPHQYASVTYELDSLLALRKRINSNDPSPAVSVNDFMIRAIAIALRRVPQMNVRWDVSQGEALPNPSVDISMAVAVPDGLILPVIANADTLGLASIAKLTKDLARRAREGTLEPEEYEGGYFGISNLGMFGIKHFSAIISPPQSGMLAVGGGGKFHNGFRVSRYRRTLA